VSTPAKALAGRRVIEIADERGAYCGKLLADMGADVIKVEPPGGDAARCIPPFWQDRRDADSSLLFLYMNTSKRGVTLDLEQAPARDLFARLVRKADVVIETLAPDRLDALGLGYERLSADNPRLVLTSISGFGQTGPHAGYLSNDLIANAVGGAMYVTGEAADPPVRLAGCQANLVTSTCAAASTMIALYHATVSGRGQHVDVSAAEVMTSVTHICGAGKFLDDGIIPKRNGTGLFASVPSGAYPCKDGLVYLMINRPLHWQALAKWINETTGNEEVLDPMFDGPSSNRIPYRELLDLFISDHTSRLTVAEVYHEGQRRHIAFTPVDDASDVASDPHLAVRGYFVDVDHDEQGTLRYPGAPFRPAATPWSISRRAPRVGEHNEDVYGGELGLTASELTELRRRGAV
jgi:crotonobetainyl-CoA:carnitine CoA-transferase CaiB-like acyl-CoA transferase